MEKNSEHKGRIVLVCSELVKGFYKRVENSIDLFFIIVIQTILTASTYRWIMSINIKAIDGTRFSQQLNRFLAYTM